jgi:hypothetical protein
LLGLWWRAGLDGCRCGVFGLRSGCDNELAVPGYGAFTRAPRW